MQEIKIEKGIPLPTSKYPFREMEVGDSFFVPYKDGKKSSSFHSQILSKAVIFINQNNKDWKFKSKSDDKGIRVWRIK